MTLRFILGEKYPNETPQIQFLNGRTETQFMALRLNQMPEEFTSQYASV